MSGDGRGPRRLAGARPGGPRSGRARSGRARSPSRLLAALATLAIVAVGLPSSASAHGGILLGAAVAGPYRAQVMAAPLVEPGASPAIDITVYLADVTNSEPIEDATVRTVVTAEGRTVHPKVNQIAGGYEAIVPVKNAFTVGQQTIQVDISGRRGTGQIIVRPTKQDTGPSAGFLIGSIAAALLLIGGAIAVRRRRGGATPFDPDEDRFD